MTTAFTTHFELGSTLRGDTKMRVGYKALAVLVLVLTQHCAYAGVTEGCTVAAGVFRNAALAEALRIAFDEKHEWQGKSFQSLPPTWKQVLTADIEEFKPKLIPVVASVMTKVPAWSEQGLDGMKKAREELLGKLDMTNDAYMIRCVKMLQE